MLSSFIIDLSKLTLGDFNIAGCMLNYYKTLSVKLDSNYKKLKLAQDLKIILETKVLIVIYNYSYSTFRMFLF